MFNYDKIVLTYAKKIRDLMEKALYFCLPEIENEIVNKNPETEKAKYKLLQQLSSLTSELLKDKKIENKILELANQSTANGENNEIKLKIFGLLRNIILHFPIFDTYEEIVLSPEILKWNNPKKSSILDFFDKNKNKTIKTKIYYNYPYDEKYKEIKTINIKIDMLKPGTEIMLSNIISLNDAIWMFSIVDYYLDFLGLKLNQQFGLSL